MNPTNAPVQVGVGCLCAGFLKWKWVTGDEHDESDASHILCKFEDAHSMVFYGKKGAPNSGRLGGRYAANSRRDPLALPQNYRGANAGGAWLFLSRTEEINMLAHGQPQNRTGLGNDRKVSVAHWVGGPLSRWKYGKAP